MRPEWISYLQSIGFRQPLMERAEAVVMFWDNVIETSPSFLFVSEYWDGENRVYESICLCNEDAFVEAIASSNTDEFDYVPLHNRIARWEIRAKNFDWVSPNLGSRLNLEIWFGESTMWNLRASGDNCMRLAELLKTYIVPHTIGHRTGGTP